ncbi:hypothetical protein [Flavobacterium sp. WV_118_3]|jgi:hypothetical protein|uniref:hypothetical protein n=1 Tax=Flavobacterium sp. WV_118_3 TaxID=3151764 RepID=UPI00321A760D
MMRLLSVFLFLNICFCYSQKNSLDIRPVNRFTNLKYLAVQGEKIQEFSYSESVIRAEKNHYAIAMTIHGHQRKFTFPFTREDLKGKESLNTGLTDAFYAEKITYHLDDKEYILYKHIDYNCYDPLCGNKHNHQTMVTGIRYFSPDYGLLFISQNNNMTLEILTRINGKEAPKDLIIAILKDNQVDNRIIKEYKKAK